MDPMQEANTEPSLESWIDTIRSSGLDPGAEIDPGTTLRRLLDPWYEERGKSEDPSGASAPAVDLSGIPQLAGDFELREPLGAGGLGIVYSALQWSVGREVAI